MFPKEVFHGGFKHNYQAGAFLAAAALALIAKLATLIR
jgi:hypothetical protein